MTDFLFRLADTHFLFVFSMHALSSTGNKQSCSHHGFPEGKELEISAASAC